VKQTLSAASPSGKVYEGIRPQSSGVPALTFIVASRNPDEHLRGDSSLLNARVQVDAWAKHAKEAEQLANEARLLMLGSSVLQATTVSGFDDFEEDTKLYRVSQDFSVWLNT